MKRPQGIFAVLSVMSAAMMSLPFLVPHAGFLSLAGLVPLLVMDKTAERYQVRRLWPWHYLTFVMWNAATTFWVCNATVGGGIFAVLANSLQMSLIFGLFRLSKKKFKGALPYVFLAAAWIAWERWYLTSAQISWPWLVLGNSFAKSSKSIQWYEWTGTLGGSLWVWACNLGIFGLLYSYLTGKWDKNFGRAAKFSSAGFLAALLICPFIVSRVVYSGYEETSDETLETLIIQPNIDPYHKFTAMTRQEQDGILVSQASPFIEGRDSSKSSSPLLVIAPETFTSDINASYPDASESALTYRRLLRDKKGVNLLYGASTHTLIPSAGRPTPLARELRDGLWYESHNSAIMTDWTGRNEIYHKSKLVVGVELTPYPAVFRPLDDLLGGVMGRDVGQEERTPLHCGGVPLGCAICYESVYGEYCTEYVKAGAKALVVITNDSWWGNTPGYRQHLDYSRLRAIETRRDIARCANSGISAFINQRGDIVSRTSWWEPATLEGTLHLSSGETFFVRHGDICGRLCTFVFILLLLLLLVRSIVPESYR